MIISYMAYTFLPETRFWSDLGLDKFPFNEIKNDWYFYIISVISLVLLIVNLISATNFDGVVLTLFDTIYIILFSRYIYLYKDHCEKRNLAEAKQEEKEQAENNKETTSNKPKKKKKTKKDDKNV